MKSNREELEKKLIDKKDEIGLVETRLDLNEVKGDSISASITQDWSRIEINYGRDLNLIPDKETENFIKKVNIQDPELEMGLSLVHHETGHRENPSETTLGFPYTLEIHDSIKESIYKGLTERGKQSNINYVTNAFEDIFDNSNCKNQTDFYGQTLFWNNEGITGKNFDFGRFGDFYETFVKINLILGGDVISHNFLRRFFSNTQKSKKAKEGFLKDLKEKFNLEHIVKFNKSKGFQEVFNEDLEKREKTASELAYLFAKHMADIVPKSPKQKMFGEKSAGESNSDNYNPFDKLMQDPDNSQKLAYKRYKEGKGPALHRDKKEQLFNLYRAISKDITIQTSEYTTSESMPIIHFGTKPFTEEDTKLRFRGIGVNDKGNFYVKTSRHSIEEPASYKVHPRDFPKLKICKMDRSGSMRLNPKNETNSSGEPINIGDTSFIPWGNNSKHHYSLKGKFGVDNFLERQGIANYVKDVALGWSGEAPLEGDYKEVSKCLLETPEGGTSFDINHLEKMLDRRALVLSLSDGEFSLDSNTKERISKKLLDCDMAHIQIGYTKDKKGNIIKNEYCKFLESKGKPVIYVIGDDDLSNAMINFVSGYYKAIGGNKR